MRRLPAPPPKRSFRGITPARREHVPSNERLRRLTEEHEEKEKPFDPERRGTWRGGHQRELVLNPADFERDLREFVNSCKLSDPEGAFEKATKLLESSKRANAVMGELDELLGMHGVEAYPPQSMHPRFYYLNSGDTYNATLVYDTEENKYFISTYGDIVEAEEPGQFEEAWSSWIRSDVERCVRRDIEDDLDLPDSVKDTLLERFDDFDDEDLKRIFRDSVGDVKHAEISTESDGSIFVHRLNEVCSEAADRVITKLRALSPNARVEKFRGSPRVTARVTMGSVEYEKDAQTGKWVSYQGGRMGRVSDPEFARELDELAGRSPNARTGAAPMTAEEFVAMLKSDADVQGRALRTNFSPRSGQLFINFYNLPEEIVARREGGGAEAENNRFMFVVDGFSTGRTSAGQGTPIAATKVKIEHSVNSGHRDYRLRGKTGSPVQVASYLAAFLTKVATEVPPKYTHSRAPNRR